jgi:hypothetical protein
MALSFSERAYRALTNRLPVDWAVRLDLARPGYHGSWGGPMNGQARRRQLVKDIFEAVPIDEVVETGAFRGTTTCFLAEVSKGDVHSVELVERFYKFAAVRCAREQPRIRLVHGDSRLFLKALADRTTHPSTFFYLDAHWQEDVPRHEELRIIHERWSDAVVMIDDFEVPGDPGYGVAMYGGHPLNERYLPPLAGWSRFYPAIASADETGARRGCIVLATRRHADRLDGLGLLRDRKDL